MAIRRTKFCSPKTMTCARLGNAFFTSMKESTTRLPLTLRLEHDGPGMVRCHLSVSGWETSILRAMCPWLKIRQKFPSKLLGICLSHCGRSEHPSPRLTHILRPTLWHSCHHTSTPGNRCILLLPNLQGQITQMGSHCTTSRF